MKVFGIDFYKGDQRDLIRAIKGDVNKPFGYVVTANVNHVVLLETTRSSAVPTTLRPTGSATAGY